MLYYKYNFFCSYIMEKSEAQKKIVDLLKENEVTMRNLYLEFSKRFLAQKSFWHSIASEEESHAAWVETLYYKIGAGLVDFSETRFPISAIENNIQFMKEAMEKAKEGKLSSLQGLEMAVHVENGMLENKFFEVFRGEDSMELQIILEALRLGTREHFREVKSAWEKEKQDSAFEQLKA